MLGTNINKFTYPIQASRGYVITSLFKKYTLQQEPVLGRWKLKYQEQELEKFYRNIPDPGYFLTPITEKSENINYATQYNHSDKRQN